MEPTVRGAQQPHLHCSDDKNSLVVDDGAKSPQRGRLYQFWTPFLYADEAQTQYRGSPQALRWFDDSGRTWSHTVYLTPKDHGTQSSQPMIRPDGSIVDTFRDFGSGALTPDLAPGAAPEAAPRMQARRRRAATATARFDATVPTEAVTSTDGVPQYAAQAGGYFPVDYIGTAISRRRLYVVFAVSSKPPARSTSTYHQVIWGVTLRR